jgi:hypothetical protein
MISATWYRLLARFERLIDGAVTNPGTGLAVSASGALEIADDGVSNAKLRQSLPLSVIGNPLNMENGPQDIQAGSDGGFLQRDAGLVVFRYPKLPSFTVATLPVAAGQGAGTMAFVTDATVTTFASVVAGGGANMVPVYCDGSAWRIG